MGRLVSDSLVATVVGAQGLNINPVSIDSRIKAQGVEEAANEIIALQRAV
jgi:hypothetical protein